MPERLTETEREIRRKHPEAFKPPKKYQLPFATRVVRGAVGAVTGAVKGFDKFMKDKIEKASRVLPDRVNKSVSDTQKAAEKRFRKRNAMYLDRDFMKKSKKTRHGG